MTVDRRKLFALGGLGAIGIGTGELGPEVDPAAGGSITVKIRKSWTEKGFVWAVMVPDFDYVWQPGLATPPVKWMPLTEWLAALDKINAFPKADT